MFALIKKDIIFTKKMDSIICSLCSGGHLAYNA